MDPADLNRVGLALSTFSGFLLAPQLIGRDRLARAHAWSAQRTEAAHAAIRQGIRTRVTSFETDWAGAMVVFLLLLLIAAPWAAVFWGVEHFVDPPGGPWGTAVVVTVGLLLRCR